MSEENPRPRVVFDCMVYLQATVNESGPAAALLRLVDNDEIALFVSREVLEEVREVLSRPKIRQRNPALEFATLIPAYDWITGASPGGNSVKPSRHCERLQERSNLCFPVVRFSPLR